MARSRSLPRDFLKDPDVMELATADHRLMLIGLVLNADDEGRGQAHPQFLACEMGYHYTPEQIDQALLDLQVHDLVQCYQVGRHRYYQLPRWLEWETLSKPTPSRYPAPLHETSTSQGESSLSQIPQGKLEKPREGLTEEEGEGKGRGNETEEEGEEAKTPKVVSIPTAYAVAASDETQQLVKTATVVARILKLIVSEDLMHLVQEYQSHPHISLEGEAYSAREWIEDRQRNKKGQRMTPAFFRRWLKREQEMQRKQEAERQQVATGTEKARAAPAHPTTAPVLPTLMNLEARNKAAITRGEND